jgi:hypothetical protein
VWRMEEVLDLHEEPYDPLLPVVCFDERPCQLIGEVRDPLPMKPGHIERFDSEYERGGVCWVLMSFEPLTGWRELVVTERRRKQEEFALAIAAPGTATLPASPEDPGGLGQPLNSYTAAAFYESFSAEQARRMARRIEFIYTPVHGSWLNMVERFFRNLSEQQLRRGIFRSVPELEQAVLDYIDKHNEAPAPFIWTKSAQDILEKVKRGRQTLNKLQTV